MKTARARGFLLGVLFVSGLFVGEWIEAAAVVRPISKFVVKVNSISNPDFNLENKTYFILSSMKNASEHDLQFQEYARYVATALSFKGYKRVDDVHDANLIVGMAYGIGNPKTEVNSQVYTTSTGYSYPVGWTWIHVQPRTRKVVTRNTTYMRYLILNAYDAGNRKTQIWNTTLKSEGTSDDLRVVLPHMIAASIFELGTNTGKSIRKVMYKNAARVLQVMQYAESQGVKPFTGKERLGVVSQMLPMEKRLLYSGQRVGVLVLAVAKDSVAWKMGIRRYDVILAVNKKPIKNPKMLSETIRKTKPGRRIRIVFFAWDQGRDVSAKGKLN